MSGEDSEESLIPSIKRRTRAYSSLIAGHQHYRTVMQSLNSYDFWNRTVNPKLSRLFRSLRKYVQDLLSY